MKKFYENPVVEITKFDVEDAITASVVLDDVVIDTLDISNEQLTALNNYAAGQNVEVVKFNAYAW